MTDTIADRVQEFSSTGTFLTKWGSAGTGDGQFNTPQGITVDAGGNVYVADTLNQRVQKFGEPSSGPPPVGRRRRLGEPRPDRAARRRAEEVQEEEAGKARAKCRKKAKKLPV